MEDKILLAHGSGGRLSHDLIEKAFLPLFDNAMLNKMDDSAVFDLKGRLAFTTDSYVVKPIFFPGGDIGKLAVCGTVNDLSTSGATPLYLSLALVIEEGFPLDDLRRVIQSAAASAREAGVKIVTGDTKVVERGSADRLFINTAGIGVIPKGVDISGANAQPGDAVIISGPIGQHGIAVLCQREGLRFSTQIESDCAPLNRLVADILGVSRNIHCLRDPTRGGMATTLNEIARQSQVGVKIDEAQLPVASDVRGACELLGFDPLYVANEGRMIVIAPSPEAESILSAMRSNSRGARSAVIGEVVAEHPGKVSMRTCLGACRVVDMLSGELLPRIC